MRPKPLPKESGGIRVRNSRNKLYSSLFFMFCDVDWLVARGPVAFWLAWADLQ